MGILLTILKWIGIILLAVIGLVLLILLLVLFCRLSYEVSGSYRENTPEGQVKVRYLLSLVRVSALFENGALDLSARVFGKKVFSQHKQLSGSGGEADEADRAEGREAAGTAGSEEAGTAGRREAEIAGGEEAGTAGREASVTADRAADDAAAGASGEAGSGVTGASAAADRTFAAEETHGSDPAKARKKTKGPEPYDEGYEAAFAQIEEDRKKEEERIRKEEERRRKDEERRERYGDAEDADGPLIRVWDRASDLIDKKDEILDLLDDDENRGAAALILRQIGKILKDILPKRYTANVRYGFEDPAQTGRVLAIASALYPVYAGNAHVEADFEQKVIEGDADIRGGLRLGVLLGHVLRLLGNKRIRSWIGMAMKKKKTAD